MGELDRIAVVVLSISLFSFPLYVAILVIIARYRKSFFSVFYGLILNQGLYDLSSMFNYFVFFAFRGTDPYADFFWNFRTGFIPLWLYACVYFFLYLRVFGILTITLNRFFACVLPFSKVDRMFRNTSRWAFLTANVILAFSVSLPTLDHTAQIDDKATMSPKQNSLNLARNTLMAASIIILIGAVCFVSYCAIIYRISFTQKLRRQKSDRAEKNAAVQLGMILAAFSLITAHYTIIFTCSLTQTASPLLETLRSAYPVWSAILSYMPAWTLLIINRDIRQRLLGLPDHVTAATSVVQPSVRP
ncbi:unnamed protein product [Caenorhabditis auriculariae]|uniref:Serpentine receptor class gamma n=1 Tax=Caenorhabditis auriculariae TaxID=2777116 RepID=A0A8S1HHH8_9PELO|nr:unnamed protein product [Caenorhabditis auriculariae]